MHPRSSSSVYIYAPDESWSFLIKKNSEFMLPIEAQCQKKYGADSWISSLNLWSQPNSLYVILVICHKCLNILSTSKLDLFQEGTKLRS